MYKAFNVKFDYNYFKGWSYQNFNTLDEKYKQKLRTLVNANKTVNAGEIKNILMPTDNFDIFISHSHKDVELAKCLAGYIEQELGLKCFIDSLYWGNIEELQEELNKEHYNEKTESYSHQKTMEVAKHANMILASALTEMIDRCECVFFLNTDNSVIPGKEALKPNQTYSPWIYHEVYTVSRIRKNVPVRRKKMSECHYARDSEYIEMPRIVYDLNLDGMIELNYDKIKEWERVSLFKSRNEKLDYLYDYIK